LETAPQTASPPPPPPPPLQPHPQSASPRVARWWELLVSSPSPMEESPSTAVQMQGDLIPGATPRWTPRVWVSRGPMETVAPVLPAPQEPLPPQHQSASLQQGLKLGLPVSSPSPTGESPSTPAPLLVVTTLGATLRWTLRAMEYRASLETVTPAPPALG